MVLRGAGAPRRERVRHGGRRGSLHHQRTSGHDWPRRAGAEARPTLLGSAGGRSGGPFDAAV